MSILELDFLFAGFSGHRKTASLALGGLLLSCFQHFEAVDFCACRFNQASVPLDKQQSICVLIIAYRNPSPTGNVTLKSRAVFAIYANPATFAAFLDVGENLRVAIQPVQFASSSSTGNACQPDLLYRIHTRCVCTYALSFRLYVQPITCSALKYSETEPSFF